MRLLSKESYCSSLLAPGHPQHDGSVARLHVAKRCPNSLCRVGLFQDLLLSHLPCSTEAMFFFGGFWCSKKKGVPTWSRFICSNFHCPRRFAMEPWRKKLNHKFFSSGWHFLHIDCWNPDLLLEMVRRPEVLLCHYALFMVSELQR